MAKHKRGKPFSKGTSGNPQGRPAGSRNKSTFLVEALIEEDLHQIIQNVIGAAKDGDMAAIRMIMDRVFPPKRSRPIRIDLPKICSASDIVDAQDKILSAVTNGELLLEEAEALNNLIKIKLDALTSKEFENRIKNLEELHSANQSKS